MKLIREGEMRISEPRNRRADLSFDGPCGLPIETNDIQTGLLWLVNIAQKKVAACKGRRRFERFGYRSLTEGDTLLRVV